ncbi:hypothetical protein BKA62DRAFT_204793 [Auriculariales sp. MPI-PUGE-AT-0066]|nr:hypothetical protein BKA62DRAFT_204793 [Auriculariales sp. MPI-PUGE-AT-0066]
MRYPTLSPTQSSSSSSGMTTATSIPLDQTSETTGTASSSPPPSPEIKRRKACWLRRVALLPRFCISSAAHDDEDVPTSRRRRDKRLVLVPSPQSSSQYGPTYSSANQMYTAHPARVYLPTQRSAASPASPQYLHSPHTSRGGEQQQYLWASTPSPSQLAQQQEATMGQYWPSTRAQPGHEGFIVPPFVTFQSAPGLHERPGIRIASIPPLHAPNLFPIGPTSLVPSPHMLGRTPTSSASGPHPTHAPRERRRSLGNRRASAGASGSSESKPAPPGNGNGGDLVRTASMPALKHPHAVHSAIVPALPTSKSSTPIFVPTARMASSTSLNYASAASYEFGLSLPVSASTFGRHAGQRMPSITSLPTRPLVTSAPPIHTSSVSPYPMASVPRLRLPSNSFAPTHPSRRRTASSVSRSSSFSAGTFHPGQASPQSTLTASPFNTFPSSLPSSPQYLVGPSPASALSVLPSPAGTHVTLSSVHTSASRSDLHRNRTTSALSTPASGHASRRLSGATCASGMTFGGSVMV